MGFGIKVRIQQHRVLVTVTGGVCWFVAWATDLHCHPEFKQVFSGSSFFHIPPLDMPPRGQHDAHKKKIERDARKKERELNHSAAATSTQDDVADKLGQLDIDDKSDKEAVKAMIRAQRAKEFRDQKKLKDCKCQICGENFKQNGNGFCRYLVCPR